MKHICSIVLTILIAAALLVGCNNGSFRSSSFITHKNKPTEKDSLLIAGTYRIKSIDGVDAKEYFSKLASKDASNTDGTAASLDAEKLDALLEKYEMILNPDGSGYFTDVLSISGKAYNAGEWRREGDTVVITVYDGNVHASFNSETGKQITYEDAVARFKYKDGELSTISEGEEKDGPAYVYAKISSSVSVPEMSEAPETAPAKADVGSAEGTYKIELIDGKDAVAYYSEDAKDEDSLKTTLSVMGISSLETLKDQMSFTLQADGNVSFAAIPDGMGKQSGTWTQDGSEVTVVLVNDGFTGSINYGKSVMTYGNTSMQFTFQNDELSTTFGFGSDQKLLVFRRH